MGAQWLLGILERLGVRCVLDPLAHTGFHAWLLQALNHDLKVEAADASPSYTVFREVLSRSAEDTSWCCYNQGWALFLSWVPHWSEVGVDALSAFKGPVLVLLGDDEEGGWTGTPRFRDEIRSGWRLVESRT